MKIYEVKGYPNPRRVEIFLIEKGVEVPSEHVDVPGGAHRREPFLSKNPYAGVPVLELDDGVCISETTAICRYFEELHPEPPLMGRTPEEKATIEMWQRRVEHSLFNAVATYFHQGTPGLGELEVYQNREWGLKNRELAVEAMRKLDPHLEGRRYLVGDAFSIADITGVCALDFVKYVDMSIPEECRNVMRWYEEMYRRPSVARTAHH